MGLFDFLTKPLGDVAQALSPVAGIASLIPGPWKPWATGIQALGAMKGQADARKKQEELLAQQQQMYGAGNPFMQQYMLALQGLGDFTDRAALDRAARAASGAADSYQMKLAGRGLTGASSALTGGLGQIYSSIPAAAGAGYGQFLEGRMGDISRGLGMSMQQAQGLGGIGNYYGSKSDAIGQDLGTLAPLLKDDLAKVGQKIGSWFQRQTGLGKRAPAAGQNTLDTNDATAKLTNPFALPGYQAPQMGKPKNPFGARLYGG